MRRQVEIQRQYYSTTALDYDRMHSGAEEEGLLAQAFLRSVVDFLQAKSVLEVGAGTGRAVRRMLEIRPEIRIVGVEPSDDLRRQGYESGLSDQALVAGDAQDLQFATGSFDIVFEFAALHHIPNPTKAITEMLRVAQQAIFIADSNNFGQGGRGARRVKQMINALGLWRGFDLLRTRGRGYHFSEGDGLFYSYSVFNDLPLIQRHCASVHVINLSGASVNHYRDAPSVALLGIKRS